MSDQHLDTKMKIMETARIFFSDKGFEGTSVREIAKTAEVNIASINYYFSNKENLFQEILREGYAKCSRDLKEKYEENKGSLEDTLVEFFRYFMDNSHDLVSFFKMMMSTQHNNKYTQGFEDSGVGPPGGKIIIDAIKKEVGDNISEANLHWGLKCLFSHVMHMSLMHNCCFKEGDVPFTSPQDIEKSIRRLSRIVVKELKEASEISL